MTEKEEILALMRKRGVDNIKALKTRIDELHAELETYPEHSREHLQELVDEVEDLREIVRYNEDGYKVAIEDLNRAVREARVGHGGAEGAKNREILAAVQAERDIKRKLESKRSAMKMQDQLTDWYAAFRRDRKTCAKYLKQDFPEHLLAAAREFQEQLGREAEVFHDKLYRNYEVIMTLIREIEELQARAERHKAAAEEVHGQGALHAERLAQYSALLGEANDGLHFMRELHADVERVLSMLEEDLDYTD